jgi:hypothetical protein
MGSAALTSPVGRGCTHRRTRAPWATRQTRTRVNVFENCYNSGMRLLPSGSWRLRFIPLSRTSRRAKALGYTRQSPPAQAIQFLNPSIASQPADREIVQNPVEALQTGNIDPLFIGVQSSAHRSETDRGNAGAAVEPGV